MDDALRKGSLLAFRLTLIRPRFGVTRGFHQIVMHIVIGVVNRIAR
ncbi:Uncharacterised protein [Vibrio cholerae]|nr:Uncharacterised protein [Vibrio cholerae]